MLHIRKILNFYTKVEWANDFLLQKRLIYI